MNPYSYSVSLRIFHPTADPEEFTRRLGLEPTRAWKVGDPRETPKGTPLEGIYKNTYWYRKLTPRGEGLLDNLPLEHHLSNVVGQLVIHESFFAEIRGGGGRVDLSIGLFGSDGFGFELNPLLIGSIESLGLTLLFEVYKHPQNW